MNAAASTEDQVRRRARADLVRQPAHGVAADQDADPDLQGVQDVVLAVGDFLGWQPDERVRPGRRDSVVETAVAQPICTIRQISQAIALIGSRSIRAAISPGMTGGSARGGPGSLGLVSVRFSLLPPKVRGVAGQTGKCGAFAGTVDGSVACRDVRGVPGNCS